MRCMASLLTLCTESMAFIDTRPRLLTVCAMFETIGAARSEWPCWKEEVHAHNGGLP